MAWWAKTGSGNTATLRKSAKSPGANWVEIPGATDSMTEQEAAQQLAQDIADGDFGSSVANGLEHVPGVKSAVDAAKQAESASKSVGQFLGDLSNRNTWIRVMKVIVGGALIIAGVARLTGATNAVKDVAGKVPIIP